MQKKLQKTQWEEQVPPVASVIPSAPHRGINWWCGSMQGAEQCGFKGLLQNLSFFNNLNLQI